MARYAPQFASGNAVFVAVFGPADTEAPTWAGSPTVGAKTSSTIAVTFPTATDNVGVVRYDYRVDGGAWVSNGASPAVNVTGLTALTSYTIDARAVDGAGNISTTMSVTTSTYREGAMGSTILLTTGPIDGNQGGILYNDVEAGDEGKWFSFYIVTPPPTGTLSINPDGTFTYSGATGNAGATFTYQLEVDGVEVGSPVTVTLYGIQAVPAPTLSGSTAQRSVATQGYSGNGVSTQSGALVTIPAATQIYRAVPVAPASGSTATAASTTVTSVAQPAATFSGATASQARAVQEFIASAVSAVSGSTASLAQAVALGDVIGVPVGTLSGSTVTSAQALLVFEAMPVGAVSGAFSTQSAAIYLNKEPSADRAVYSGPPTRATYMR